MKSIVKLGLCLSIIFSSFALADSNIIGTYHCSGDDPYTPRHFDSIMTIQQKNNVYVITETTVDHNDDNAIGLVTDDILSLTYQAKADKNLVGVQAMKIKKGGKLLTGPWAQLGKTQSGRETCTKSFTH